LSPFDEHGVVGSSIFGAQPLCHHLAWGYGVAMQMLVASQETGWYSSIYKQFNMIWHFKTAFGNQIRASTQANCMVAALGDSDGKSCQLICSEPCASI
jgi:hypothetical protein